MRESRHRRHRRQRGNLPSQHQDDSEVHPRDDRCLAAIYGKQALFVNSIQDYRRSPRQMALVTAPAKPFVFSSRRYREWRLRGQQIITRGGVSGNSAEDHRRAAIPAEIATATPAASPSRRRKTYFSVKKPEEEI